MPYRLACLTTVVVALAGAVQAYRASWLTAEQPVHCVPFPFGNCTSIMASGWAILLGDLLDGDPFPFIARAVPLLGWLALGIAIEGSVPVQGRRLTRPGQYQLFGLAAVLIVAAARGS